MNEYISLLEPILNDPEIMEILIDGHERIHVEKHGRLMDIESPFKEEAQLLGFIDELTRMVGQTANESNPLVDLRLADGTRVNIVLPPISRSGPLVTMRKFMRRMLTVDDLLQFGSLNQTLADFLKACVQGRLNIVVAGGTGSGKTTFLNVVAHWIDEEERVIVLQSDFEFPLPLARAITLETRPANREGRGEVSMTDLVRNAFRMRPERIIAVEVFGSEVFDLLAGINNGHDGSMFSLHASSPRDALSRLEFMAGMGNPSVPLLTVREQISSAIDIITYQERLPDGRRRITKITEVSGVEDGVIATRDLFEFRRTGTENGRIQGIFTATGAIPHFLTELRQYGIDLPISMFTPA